MALNALIVLPIVVSINNKGEEVISDLFNLVPDNISLEDSQALELTFNSIYPLMLLFDCICSLMNHDGKLSEEEMGKFKTLIYLQPNTENILKPKELQRNST